MCAMPAPRPYPRDAAVRADMAREGGILSRRRELVPRRLDACLFDLVEERLVGHPEPLRRPATVPLDLLQRVDDRGPLRSQRGFARNIEERAAVLPLQRSRRRRRGNRRRRLKCGGRGRGDKRPLDFSTTGLDSSRATSCSSCRMTNRLIVFSSSRTFPGHSYAWNSRQSSGGSMRTGRL